MATLAPTHFPPLPPTRFTVDQYHKMIQAGILGEDDPVELLDGLITYKMARNPPHDAAIGRGQRLFFQRFGESFAIRIQSAVTLSNSEPEPDLAVAIGPHERYDNHHPGASELLLVVEVADSSLDRDRDFKGPIYAAAGIRTYWIVNLAEGHVEVYTDPTGPSPEPAYGSRRDYKADEAIPLVGFDPTPAPILVRDLLPKAP